MAHRMDQSIGILAQLLVALEANPIRAHLVRPIHDFIVSIAPVSRSEVHRYTRLLSVWRRILLASQSASEITSFVPHFPTKPSTPSKNSCLPMLASKPSLVLPKLSISYREE